MGRRRHTGVPKAGHVPGQEPILQQTCPSFGSANPTEPRFDFVDLQETGGGGARVTRQYTDQVKCDRKLC